MPAAAVASFDQAQERGFYSLLHLAQALGAQDIVEPLRISVISNRLHLVTGEETLQPERATVLGPCKVIPQEYPNIRCSNIDLGVLASETRMDATLLDQLIAEATASESLDTVVAYRGGERWVRSFEQTRLAESTHAIPPLREGGAYLITGGLGGIGLALAKSLAQKVKAKLVLVGRTAIPERETWAQWLKAHDEQDPLSRKIRHVQALEALGAQVMVISADVTDPDQMQKVIDRTHKRFGTINGVIHAAGVAGGGMVQLKTPNIAASVLAPKVKGTLVLDAVLKDDKLDFLVLCSSMTAILGGFGQVDYCGANAFLDAFANGKTATDDKLVVSINWDAWNEIGMAVDTALPRDLQERRAEALKQGILTSEGVDVFSRILNTSLSQVVVSPVDLPGRLRNSSSPEAAIPKEPAKKPILSQPVLQPGHAQTRTGHGLRGPEK